MLEQQLKCQTGVSPKVLKAGLMPFQK